MRLNAQQVSRHEPDEEGDHVETHGVTVLYDACQAVARGAGRHEPLDGEQGGVGQRVDEVIVEAQGLGYVTTQEGVGEALGVGETVADAEGDTDGTLRPTVRVVSLRPEELSMMQITISAMNHAADAALTPMRTGCSKRCLRHSR